MPCDGESELLTRLLRDDPGAWRELVEKYSALLLSISRRTFATYGFDAAAADCEDAVAEVWRNLLAHQGRLLRQCHARGNLLATLHVLARNRTIDIMRRRRLMTQPLEATLAEVPADEPMSDSDDRLLKQLPRAIERLSSRERTLVELFFLQRKKYREIELLTGISQNSVGPTLNRALVKLRQILDASESSETLRLVPTQSA